MHILYTPKDLTFCNIYRYHPSHMIQVTTVA